MESCLVQQISENGQKGKIETLLNFDKNSFFWLEIWEKLFHPFDQYSTKFQSSIFDHFCQFFGQNKVPKVCITDFFHKTDFQKKKKFSPRFQFRKK